MNSTKHEITSLQASRRLSRRAAIGQAGAVVLATSALAPIGHHSAFAVASKGTLMNQSTPVTSSGTPTVVLVHGAFADGSSWADVISRLQVSGITVHAVANPLRGVTTDSAYLASFVSQISGPVLLVGHSYGGAVIGNAAANATNVVGLVYVAAFAPEVGEALGEVSATSKDSLLGPALLQLTYPTGQGSETAAELVVDPAKFHDVFAADLPAEQAAVLAATQRPIAAAAFTDKTTGAAWHTLPSWAVIATEDKAAGTDVVRSMAERAKAQVTEVPGAHLPMISHPDAIAEVILAAITSVG